ncbi:MAG: hypothetical protein WAX69_25560 [Victivallales bacterium]
MNHQHQIMPLIIFLSMAIPLFSQELVYDPAVQMSVETTRGTIIEGDRAKLDRMNEQISLLNSQLNRLSELIATDNKILGEAETIRVRNGDPDNFQSTMNTKLLKVEKAKTAEEAAAPAADAPETDNSIDSAYRNYLEVNRETVGRRESLSNEIGNLGGRINQAKTDADVQKAQAAINAVSVSLDAEQDKERQAADQLKAEHIRAENERWKKEEEALRSFIDQNDPGKINYDEINFQDEYEKAKKEIDAVIR